jgi:hypothetical protein
MDYTKNGVPYMDERFLESDATPTDAPVQEALRPAQVAAEVQPTEEAVAAAQETPPPVCDTKATDPRFSMASSLRFAGALLEEREMFKNLEKQRTRKDAASEVFEKIQSRKETLESLDDKTPEMKTAIKTLEWVLDTITKTRACSQLTVSTNDTQSS